MQHALIRLIEKWRKCLAASQGRIQTEVEGGATWRGGAKNTGEKLARRRRAKIFGALFEKIIWFFYRITPKFMFRRIQNESLKKECIRVRIRGAFLAKKGAPKLYFHREGGAVAPICPPKSATAASGIVGTVLMDLSKGYDCLDHDLLIANLETSGFDSNSHRLLYSNLDSRH